MGDCRKPHIRGKRFCNHEHEKINGFLIHSTIMLLRSWWRSCRNIQSSDVNRWSCQIKPISCSINPTITWIGHSSFLIQLAGLNILTDPIFGNMSVLYPRLLKAAISVNSIPKIDFVLISHNHRDHMDSTSLMALRTHPDVSFLVPMGDKLWFDHRSFVRVKEYTWWERQSFKLRYDPSKEIHFTFLPANHWSQRGILDKNKSLWGSWMIECNGYNIYFAGDTSYDSHFLEISKAFSDIHISLLPIGPCEPRVWVKGTHLDAQEAGQAFLDLGARHLIPMHWGTFPMGEDQFDMPIELIRRWWEKNQIQLNNKSLHLPKFGEPFRFDENYSCLKN